MASCRRIQTRQRHRPASGRGQAITEFALVAPILLFIVLAIIQLGILLETKNAVTFAANQGVRMAAIHGADDGPKPAVPFGNDEICAAIVQGLSSGGLNPSQLGTVLIYDGNSAHGLNATATGNTTLQDTGTCVVTTTAPYDATPPLTPPYYVWQYGTASYPPYERNVIAPPDPIGVSIIYNYKFVLPLFGAGLTLGSAGIQQMEPQFAANTAAGTGPTAGPTYTPTPYPSDTAYATNTAYPTYTITPTPSNTPIPSNTPTPSDTPIS